MRKINYIYTEEFNINDGNSKEELKVIFNNKFFKTIMKIENIYFEDFDN